ncbi:MAG: isopenicillin N synthase family oxygenase [Gammaproteobacteria bacterium]|nr:isopenicillin N synthase family oxygenase [Gammaproteobacteria bacterium]
MGGLGIESRARAIPVIDMGTADQGALDDALWQAAAECGFLQLTGHGFSLDEMDAAFAAAERFFALPDAVKARHPLRPNTNAGWESKSQVRPSTGTPDQKESYQITRPRMQGLWPSPARLPGFADTLLGFERKAWRLAMRVLASFARKLGFADDFFAKAHDCGKDDYQCTLRLLHYFPVAESSGLAGPDGGKLWRAGAHTDFDCLTLLFQRDGEGGLQVCPGKEADSGAWTPVTPRADLITCNIGDMLMRWSDDALRSTLHRVYLPRNGGGRLSIAFFAQANGSQWIRGPKGKHAPITAQDYLRQRIAANFSVPPGAGSER